MPHHLFYRLIYSVLHTYWVWSRILNRSGRAAMQVHPPRLSGVHWKAVQELQRNGICLLRFEEVFPQYRLSHYLELAEAELRREEMQRRIREAQEAIARSGKGTTHKYYLVKGWNPLRFDGQNKLAQLALHDEFLDIAAAYLGVRCRLLYVDLWYNCPMEKGNVYSQQWHRDADDKRLVKLFFYLRDVEESSGPFHYIPGTHDAGPFKRVLPSAVPYNVYPPAHLVDKIFPQTQRIVCVGPAGTIVLADTTGLHKGGHAVKNPRYLFHVTYYTDGYFPPNVQGIKNWILDKNWKGPDSPSARFALNLPADYRIAP